MKLIVYPFSNAAPPVRAAPAQRGWMDATPQSFAYRCLPLTIANPHGWEVLNPRAFTARWGGEERKESVTIAFEDPPPEPKDNYVRPMGHFGSGVLTFELPMMFKTPPGWSLWVQGPVNQPKDAIAPLTGVIETDWSPYTFTMNWMFTRADVEVRFAAGEPVAHLFPVRRSTLERVEPEIRNISEDLDRKEQNDLWRDSRGGFLQALDAQDPEAVAEKWQKAYYRGVRPDGKPGAKDHQIKLRLAEFAPPKKKRT
ncbi:MAG: DUF6065 family protein [Caulobacterales bacterium]|nr:DUF6065 family protein [Caulobacterales bacterium]